MDSLADARIRAWLALPPGQRPPPPDVTASGAPLEVQLAVELRRLDALADAAAGDEKAVFARQADAIALRLMVLLEQQGRPLAARDVAARRAGGG